VDNGSAQAAISLLRNMVILLHRVNDFIVHRTKILFGPDIDTGPASQKIKNIMIIK
jgi:hypothetical protein